MADVPYRILIVDDEVDFADVLRVEFTRSGFDATAVHDGTQALAAMDTAVFDAILTDILMPKMNGVAFVGLARTHRKTLAEKVRSEAKRPKKFSAAGDAAAGTHDSRTDSINFCWIF